MSEDQLSKIHRFLGLETADKRLKLKAEIMKTTLFLASQWKEGIKNEWISKIANRTCVSTRKIRENYIEPLIDEGILKETRGGYIQFLGLPNGAEIPIEQTEDYTKKSEQKEELIKSITTELLANPKLIESDIVEKFATKEIDEDFVAFCYDVAKNRILLESQKVKEPAKRKKPLEP